MASGVWRAEAGSGEAAEGLKLVNTRLRKVVSDLTLDKPILEEAALGNY